MVYMTNELAKSIENTSVRCTQATLRVFGVEGCPHLGSGCLIFLTRAGYKLTQVKQPPRFLASFKYDTTKNYLINTRGHAMALINGILIDTERKGFDNRRIDFIWEVIK